MKKSLLITLGLALGFAQNASAQTIFSCTTKSGKIATLDKEGNNYIYAFGKPHKTEIRLVNSMNQVLANKLTGHTYHTNYAENMFVALISGNYTYVLRHYFGGVKYPEEANIYVLKNGKKIANLNCSDWNGDFDDNIRSQEADFDLAMDLI